MADISCRSVAPRTPTTACCKMSKTGRIQAPSIPQVGDKLVISGWPTLEVLVLYHTQTDNYIMVRAEGSKPFSHPLEVR